MITAEERAILVEIFVYHYRKDNAACGCGWAELGHSHAEHVAEVFESSLLMRQETPQATMQDKPARYDELSEDDVMDLQLENAELRRALKLLMLTVDGRDKMDYDKMISNYHICRWHSCSYVGGLCARHRNIQEAKKVLDRLEGK